MAKMTNKIVQEQDERKEISAAGMFQRHFDDIQSLLDLISAFRESGFHSMIKSMLTQKDDVLEVVSSDLLNAENARFIQNALSIYALLSRVDPEIMRHIVLTAADAMMNADAFKKEPPLGLLRINSMLKDPDISAGIRVMLSAIGAMTSSRKQQ